MENINEILEIGTKRAQDAALPYRGALTPAEAYKLLQNYEGAQLVDVRTRAEWEWVGRPAQAVHIEWNTWPAGTRNPEFADTLGAAAPDKQAPLLFICRSGVRSSAAATLAAELGYRNAFNVLEGFEGDKDPDGHRNRVNGWRVHHLPWIQT